MMIKTCRLKVHKMSNLDETIKSKQNPNNPRIQESKDVLEMILLETKVEALPVRVKYFLFGVKGPVRP